MLLNNIETFILSNVRFTASFRHLVESTHLLRRDTYKTSSNHHLLTQDA